MRYLMWFLQFIQNREEVYKKNAIDYNFELPTFKANVQRVDYKIVSSNKLQEKLGYEFIYPNPLYFPIEI